MITPLKFVVGLVLTLALPISAAESVQPARDLASESRLAVSQDRVYLLYVSRKACPYCKLLEKNVLVPMLNNDDYYSLVDLREISWEGGTVVDFDLQSRTAIEVIHRFEVSGTPTLLFLDESGHELSERIVGYHSEDFYWYYFDKTIVMARSKLLGR